ncbi:MAG TPA: GntR family transcriptional regulator [Acidimicrobiales bacterium]|nr:GntR family transcriptional regulator [Acidimicrobiales bacterium]
MRRHSVAELVADQIRERIVSGQVQPGEVLPKQESLLVEFGVSQPSLREALRILETEGLVRVRRGKHGGTVVQQPQVDSTAHAIELALRARGVSPGEVATALRFLEPVCAGLCAAREDRATEVVPRLQAAHEAVLAVVDDVPQYTARARAFHAELVNCCGNDTIALVLGALERICSDDSTAWAEQLSRRPAKIARTAPIADAEYRRSGVDAHATIVERIAAGDVRGAEEAAREHAASRSAAQS